MQFNGALYKLNKRIDKPGKAMSDEAFGKSYGMNC